MIIFDSEEYARGAGDRVSAIAADAPATSRSMASRFERSSPPPKPRRYSGAGRGRPALLVFCASIVAARLGVDFGGVAFYLRGRGLQRRLCLARDRIGR